MRVACCTTLGFVLRRLIAPAGREPAARAVPGCAPGCAVTSFASPKEVTKKRRPNCRALRFAAGCTEACNAVAGKKELALFACGERGSDNFFSDSATALQASARQTGAGHSARCASQLVPHLQCGDAWIAKLVPTRCLHPNPPPAGEGNRTRVWSFNKKKSPAARSLSTGCERSERRPFGPHGRRRAAQGRADQKGRLFEPAQRASSRPFPPGRSSAEQSALGRPPRWGRLFLVTSFGEAKEVTAPPGAFRAKAARPHRPAGATPPAPRTKSQ